MRMLLMVLGAVLGLIAGAGLWWVVWSLPWFDELWVFQGSTLVINDPLEAIGKVITLVLFPIVGIVQGAKLAGRSKSESRDVA